MLTGVLALCYGARLSATFLGITTRRVCHELCWVAAIFFFSCASYLQGQTSPATSTSPAEPCGPGEAVYTSAAGTQEIEGDMMRLRRSAVVCMGDLLLRAEEIDYNRETKYAEARGNVSFQNRKTGEHLTCTLAQYRLDQESGQFFNVTGIRIRSSYYEPLL